MKLHFGTDLKNTAKQLQKYSIMKGYSFTSEPKVITRKQTASKYPL